MEPVMKSLSVQHVQKNYGRLCALQDVSFDLEQGEILVLLGPNGAGKSTLLKILATLLNKDAGQVNIFGHDLDREADIIRQLSGYTAQGTGNSAYARLTILENLQFSGALRGLSDVQIRRQVENLAVIFDFRKRLDNLFDSLSDEQKQLTVILRALLHDPALLYLDEPTCGLDPLSAAHLRCLLKNYASQQGKTILLTSHNLNEAEEMNARVAFIRDGKIPLCGTPGQLKQNLGVETWIELVNSNNCTTF
jgi:ABC-2 type transport system ATP-binding protein